MVGNDIEIAIVAIDGDQVKIGINAPKEIEIYRKEVYLSIQEANMQAVEQIPSLEILKNILPTKK